MKAQTVENIYIFTGLTVSVIFVSLLISFPFIYDAVVDSVLTLKEGGPIMEAYKIPPIVIYMKFYVFNVTNAMDVLYYKERPILQEIGPYVYEESREKFDDSFSDSGNHYSYKNQFEFSFSREMTDPSLSESDMVTTLNIILVAMASVLQNRPKAGRFLWPQMESSMDLFMTQNVSNVLFKGWELPYLNFNFNESNIDILANNLHFEGYIKDFVELFPEGEPSEILEENRIGYFTLLNDTYDGYYKVQTGLSDMTQYLEVDEWNNETVLSYWGDDYCNMINGTDGTQFPPRVITKDTTVYIYVTQLCRSLYLYYDTEVNFRGINTLRFRPPKSMLESPLTNPLNECFCGETLGCLPSGLLEMSPCTNGVPVVSSTPHFYNGDYNEWSKFNWSEPDKDLHDTILDLEPVLGVPVSAHKRIQLNLPIKKYSLLTSFMNFDDIMYFPIVWADETATMTDEQGDAMHDVLTVPYIIVYTVGGIILIVGLVAMGVGIRKRIVRRRAPVV